MRCVLSVAQPSFDSYSNQLPVSAATGLLRHC